MNNQSSLDKLDYLLYKKTAKIYDNQRFTGRAGEWGHSRQVAILKNMVPEWQGKEVLEIGCGTGRITEALARWGAKVTATDINAEMIGIAKERFRRNRDLAISGFREMSVYNIDMDIKRFDYVIMVNVWGHLSKSYEAIYNIASNVSSRCKLIFTFPYHPIILSSAALQYFSTVPGKYQWEVTSWVRLFLLILTIKPKGKSTLVRHGKVKINLHLLDTLEAML